MRTYDRRTSDILRTWPNPNQLAWQLVIDWGLAREAAKVLASHGAPLADAREELLAGAANGIQ